MMVPLLSQPYLMKYHDPTYGIVKYELKRLRVSDLEIFKIMLVTTSTRVVVAYSSGLKITRENANFLYSGFSRYQRRALDESCLIVT